MHSPNCEGITGGWIDMRGSCCGHGERDGTIHLQDGRMLVIKKDGDKYYKESLGAQNTIENG